MAEHSISICSMVTSKCNCNQCRDTFHVDCCSNSSQKPCAELDHSIFLDPTLGQSPASTPWMQEQPRQDFHLQVSQAEILAGRASSVSQQHGQITPPDDNSPTVSGNASHQPPQRVSGGAPPMNAKSERARNAANQRHAKAKKARKDSVQSRKLDSPIDEEGEEVDGKREKYREKNRVAASKCRAKKKMHTEDLEESARQIMATNSKLRAEERELRDVFSSLRHLALSHDSTQGCKCSAIHMYNNHKANEAARTAAMGLIGMGVSFQNNPSPSTESDMSNLNSPQFGPESRAQSFSTSRPRSLAQHGRDQPMGEQVGYLVPGTVSEPRRQSQSAQHVGVLDAAGDCALGPTNETEDHSMELC